ncbi:hypothetical protein F4677DRAFT_462539 [Hypoxylon crocopeplum]|nr:hypothetical protein F4677DRAFT_462539 [Hypoxylon crocopeplum]
MAKGYNEEASVYDTRPYHAYCLSDEGEEDDDICVWAHNPELLDVDDSEEEQPADHYKDPHPHGSKEREGARADGTAGTGQNSEVNEVGSHDMKLAEDSGRLTDEEFRDRQIAYALSTARRNLTRMSQFVLKLECRAGKVTKEGIRQTLDATVADNAGPFERNDDDYHLEEIEEIKFLSEGVWQRMYLVDRHWRRQSRTARDEQGESPSIQLESEPGVKAWLKEETRTNHLAFEETCYFTVRDLARGRMFEEWIVYLKNLCGFKDHPADEAKLVELGWRFLDRDLRGPRPPNPTKVKDFVIELEDKFYSGAFNEALKRPDQQEQDDEKAWKAIRKYWSSRFQH